MSFEAEAQNSTIISAPAPAKKPPIILKAGGGGAARVGSVSTLRVGSDARVGSVHCGDARVGSLKHHLNGFTIKKRT